MTAGKLSLVGTPIGNLADLSYRAKETLEQADYVLAEDTRVAQKLFQHYQIKTKLSSFHQHSNDNKSKQILADLQSGKHIALVTDAGMPTISDPGAQLVAQIRASEAEIVLEVIPGPSALTTALALAGPGFDQFIFLGFLPHKKGRETLIKKIINSDLAIVLYESKHRLVKLLESLNRTSEDLGKDKYIVVLRELTKLYESHYYGKLSQVYNLLKDQELKGEFVVLIRNLKNNK